MVWFYPTYHERYCTSACIKVRERRKCFSSLSAFVFLRLQKQLLVFTWTCKKITLKSLALIAPRKETQIRIEVRQIWPVLYWSNCGQNFLQNEKLCRMMKKRPFSRVLSLKNGLFLVEVRRLELRASWSQTRRSTRWATPRRWKNLWNCSSHRTGQNCGQTTFAGVGQTANARFSSVFLAFPRFFEERIG